MVKLHLWVCCTEFSGDVVHIIRDRVYVVDADNNESIAVDTATNPSSNRRHLLAAGSASCVASVEDTGESAGQCLPRDMSGHLTSKTRQATVNFQFQKCLDQCMRAYTQSYM